MLVRRSIPVTSSRGTRLFVLRLECCVEGSWTAIGPVTAVIRRLRNIFPTYDVCGLKQWMLWFTRE